MSIALRNFQGIHTPIQRIQEDSNLRMLLVICGAIAAPSLILTFFLSGWVLYVFVAIAAVNVIVPIMAYAASLNPPRALDDDSSVMPRQQLVLEEATLPIGNSVPAEKITHKV